MVLVLPQRMVGVLMGCSEDDELFAFHQLLPLHGILLETLHCSTNASHKDKNWHFGSIVLHKHKPSAALEFTSTSFGYTFFNFSL
jgi:hypothetical protein